MISILYIFSLGRIQMFKNKFLALNFIIMMLFVFSGVTEANTSPNLVKATLIKRENIKVSSETLELSSEESSTKFIQLEVSNKNDSLDFIKYRVYNKNLSKQPKQVVSGMLMPGEKKYFSITEPGQYYVQLLCGESPFPILPKSMCNAEAQLTKINIKK
jgi:hypothetical protein